MYQSCTEFGYFQTAPSSNSLRATNITLQWHYDVCAKLFGTALIPAVANVNARYGYGCCVFLFSGTDAHV